MTGTTDMPTVETPAPDTPMEDVVPTIVEEVKDEEKIGDQVGQTKWFNDRLGYGFITICSGDNKGKDIFVHHSGIRPSNSNYKTLKKGEYVQFNTTTGPNGLQALDVSGIGGGPLMCDFVNSYGGGGAVTRVVAVSGRGGAGGRGRGGRGGRGRGGRGGDNSTAHGKQDADAENGWQTVKRRRAPEDANMPMMEETVA